MNALYVYRLAYTQTQAHVKYTNTSSDTHIFKYILTHTPRLISLILCKLYFPQAGHLLFQNCLQWFIGKILNSEELCIISVTCVYLDHHRAKNISLLIEPIVQALQQLEVRLWMKIIEGILWKNKEIRKEASRFVQQLWLPYKSRWYWQENLRDKHFYNIVRKCCGNMRFCSDNSCNVNWWHTCCDVSQSPVQQ